MLLSGGQIFDDGTSIIMYITLKTEQIVWSKQVYIKFGQNKLHDIF